MLVAVVYKMFRLITLRTPSMQSFAYAITSPYPTRHIASNKNVQGILCTQNRKVVIFVRYHFGQDITRYITATQKWVRWSYGIKTCKLWNAILYWYNMYKTKATKRLLASPSHQQTQYRLCGINRTLSPYHRWIPRTKASDTELWCFLWSLSE